MTGWVPIRHLDKEIRCLVSDGENYYMGGYMTCIGDDGSWYADDNAPILSEDITHYRLIDLPGKDMIELAEERAMYKRNFAVMEDQKQQLRVALELKQSELVATYQKVYIANDVARDAMQQVNTLTEALQEIENAKGSYSGVVCRVIARKALQSIKDTPREEQPE